MTKPRPCRSDDAAPSRPAASRAAPTKAAAAKRRRPARAASSPLTREQSAERLLAALGDHLRSLLSVIERVGDSGTDADIVVGHLAALAGQPRRPAKKGQERAWLLSALLRLLGASAAEPDPRRLPLLRRAKPSPGRIEIRPERMDRLRDALQGIARHERASVVLVVQEGLSLDQASRVLGHSRQEFAEAYAEGIEALDDELIEALMTH